MTTTEELITPHRYGLQLGLLDVWNRRELLYVLAKRNILARYKQMALGVAWVLLEPFAQLAILSVVFGYLLRVDTGGIPYPVFAFAGLAPWLLFSRTLMATAGAMQENMAIVSKVYFPRLIVPLAAAIREGIDGLIVFAVFLAFAASYNYWVGAKILHMLGLFAIAWLFAFGLGLIFAAPMVRFRDLRYAIQIMLQAGMYATPVFYAATLVPLNLMDIYTCNPMYWVVEFFRGSLLGREVEMTHSLWVATAIVAGTVFGGLLMFARLERATVDVQ